MSLGIDINHPLKRIEGKVEITSENHGFEVVKKVYHKMFSYSPIS